MTCGDVKCNQGRGVSCETCVRGNALVPAWMRSFHRGTERFFFDPAFDEQMRRIDTERGDDMGPDLRRVRDILDESKAFVLPLEPIEAPPPHQTSWRIANGVIAAIFVGVAYALLTGQFS